MDIEFKVRCKPFFFLGKAASLEYNLDLCTTYILLNDYYSSYPIVDFRNPVI